MDPLCMLKEDASGSDRAFTSRESRSDPRGWGLVLSSS